MEAVSFEQHSSPAVLRFGAVSDPSLALGRDWRVPLCRWCLCGEF